MNLEFHQDDNNITIYISKSDKYADAVRATLGIDGNGSIDSPITKDEAHKIIELMFKNLDSSQ